MQYCNQGNEKKKTITSGNNKATGKTSKNQKECRKAFKKQNGALDKKNLQLQSNRQGSSSVALTNNIAKTTVRAQTLL